MRLAAPAFVWWLLRGAEAQYTEYSGDLNDDDAPTRAQHHDWSSLNHQHHLDRGPD
eukprot:gene32262-63405_t